MWPRGGLLRVGRQWNTSISTWNTSPVPRVRLWCAFARTLPSAPLPVLLDMPLLESAKSHPPAQRVPCTSQHPSQMCHSWFLSQPCLVHRRIAAEVRQCHATAHHTRCSVGMPSTLELLQLLLNDPLKEQLGVGARLPPHGLQDVHLVELFGLAGALNLNFDVDHTTSTHRASARRRRSAGAVPGSTGRWAGGRRLTRPPATSSRSRGVGDRLDGACGPLAPALRPRALSPRSAEPWLMPACAAANAGMAVGPSPPHAHFAGGRGGWSQRRRPDRPSRAGRRVAGSHDGRITHMGHGVRT